MRRSRLAKFVEEYRISRNGIDAAKKAGYPNPESASSELLLNKWVSTEVQRLDKIEGYVPEVSEAELVNDLYHACKKMETAEKFPAYVGGMRLLFEARGMLVDKHEISDKRVDRTEIIATIKAAADKWGWLKEAN